jgi:membrane-bound serine protease (ClpP class)
MLLLIGVYGLIFEFLNPGTIAPGLIGTISLVVALYALNFLPINYAGAGLVLLGAVLLGAEAHIGAFGAIGIAGIVAFVLGAIMMFPRAPGFALSPWTVAEAVAATAGLFLLVLGVLFRARRRVVMAGMRALLGAEGEALSWQGLRGRIMIKGETYKGKTWRARAAAPLRPRTRVKVIDRDGLVLVVEPT